MLTKNSAKMKSKKKVGKEDLRRNAEMREYARLDNQDARRSLVRSFILMEGMVSLFILILNF